MFSVTQQLIPGCLMLACGACKLVLVVLHRIPLWATVLADATYKLSRAPQSLVIGVFR